MFFRYIYSACLVFSVLPGGAAFAQQTVQDFYLSNYQEDGSKAWELKGKEAQVYESRVEINDMNATYYGKDQKVDISADHGTMNKPGMDTYLRDNVRVKGEDGSSLYTESLFWKNDSSVIASQDDVWVEKGDMHIEAEGFQAEPRLKKVDFQKNVKVNVPQENQTVPLVIECRGPLEVDLNSGTAVFKDEVAIDSREGKIFSDKATVYFDSEDKTLIKIVAEGNVKMIRDDNVTFAQRAVYLETEKKLFLEGSPRLILFPDNEDFRD